MFKASILLIEDDPTVEALIIEVLNDAGYRIASASAANYDDTALQFRPDVIVIGWHPRANFEQGWRMAQHLTELVPSSMFLMLSTNEAALHEIGQTQRGHLFDAGLLKPFTLSALLGAINTCAPCQHVVANLNRAPSDTTKLSSAPH